MGEGVKTTSSKPHILKHNIPEHPRVTLKKVVVEKKEEKKVEAKAVEKKEAKVEEKKVEKKASSSGLLCVLYSISTYDMT